MVHDLKTGIWRVSEDKVVQVHRTVLSMVMMVVIIDFQHMRRSRVKVL